MKLPIAILVLASSLLTGPALSSPAPLPTSIAPDDTRVPLRWGIGLETDRPFYRPGETALVRFILANSSAQEAYGSAPVGGGNGCQYAVTVTDVAGNLVYEPGSIVRGMFSGPGCLFREITWSLPSHSTERGELRVPLIYQNRGGVGALGSDLPPGAYSLSIQVSFAGPRRAPWMTPYGKSFSASVPFLIEP